MFFQDFASPFDSPAQMRVLQDRLSRLVNNAKDVRRNEYPPINVWASDKSVVITAEIPGVELDDIDLQVCNQIVTLKAKRTQEVVDETPTVHRRERGYGEFTRSLELPYAIDADNVDASFTNGVLRVEFARAAVDLPKRIAVQASA
ncbi:MAG: Hsp20/alpha crystallin family protein [Cyanobacteria bacterium REEB67]|nr:Hsp20/alpha crystallin family protein [Cyanobacteria bacterium REEB67]